jgi:hypothetical protein
MPLYSFSENQVNSVSIMCEYRLGDWDWFLAGAKEFSSGFCIQIGLGLFSLLSIHWVPGVLSFGVNSDYGMMLTTNPPSDARIKKE